VRFQVSILLVLNEENEKCLRYLIQRRLSEMKTNIGSFVVLGIMWLLVDSFGIRDSYE
jgi:hypothetical protein